MTNHRQYLYQSQPCARVTLDGLVKQYAKLGGYPFAAYDLVTHQGVTIIAPHPRLYGWYLSDTGAIPEREITRRVR